MNEPPKTIEEFADELAAMLDRFIDPEYDIEERDMVTSYCRFRAESLGQTSLPFEE